MAEVHPSEMCPVCGGQLELEEGKVSLPYREELTPWNSWIRCPDCRQRMRESLDHINRKS